MFTHVLKFIHILKGYSRSSLFVWTVFFLLFGGNTVFAAQNWAESLFKIKSHNFGKVALQSNSEFRFVFQNTLKNDIQIASISSSCGCTIPTYSKKVIKSMETGEIIATVNTSGQHQGKRSATITVRFDRPSEAYVQLEVAVYIRPDVVLNPGSVDFGTVREGKSITRTVQVQYAGNPNWKIQKIETSTPYLAYRAVDESQGNPGEVTYNVTITLSDKTPAGYFRDNLRFITDEGTVNERGERNSSIIELPVNAVILDNLIAKPSPFQFGMVSPDEVVTKYLVLRGAQSFRITKVSTNDPRFQFSFPEEKSNIQIIAVTLTPHKRAKESSELISRTIRVETDIQDQGPMFIEVHARLLDEATAHFNNFFAEPSAGYESLFQSSISFVPEQKITISESEESPLFTVTLEPLPVKTEPVPKTVSKKKSKSKKATLVTTPPEFFGENLDTVQQRPLQAQDTKKDSVDSGRKVAVLQPEVMDESLVPPRVRFGVPKTAMKREPAQELIFTTVPGAGPIPDIEGNEIETDKPASRKSGSQLEATPLGLTLPAKKTTNDSASKEKSLGTPKSLNIELSETPKPVMPNVRSLRQTALEALPLPIEKKQGTQQSTTVSNPKAEKLKTVPSLLAE